MCLLLFAYRCHPDYPLLLIANRDEFYRRPSAAAAPWPGERLIAGRDLEALGTWAGISPGRAAAVTNIREPAMPDPSEALSRGEIPQQFLSGKDDPETFIQNLQPQHYRGFNALLFDVRSEHALLCAGNRHTPFIFRPGVHGISNGSPDEPWPKVENGKTGLAEIVPNANQWVTRENFVEPAMALLRDRSQAPDKQLPGTGIPLALERALSAIFVQIDTDDNSASSPLVHKGGYGTRASTVITVDRKGECQLWEQTYTNGIASGPILYFSTR
ncbi:NRDE family protein [Microbulbifer sp. OS29]|uniref:NRDE family protein n=1 Tax=Microbulbifer okhotskensis TaxID=2926617 RepID=A0A9X2J3B8_9GAMM|nr:NRDE family protein [Microbulbifer okhotskensis]MCO1333387.1 NRDE family protein [Microbulbifer okhotskensis]